MFYASWLSNLNFNSSNSIWVSELNDGDPLSTVAPVVSFAIATLLWATSVSDLKFCILKK